MCDLRIEIGDGTVFSNATGSDNVLQLPSDCAPSLYKYGTLIARTGGQWAAVTYYNASCIVEINGKVYIRGNVNNLKQCEYITGDFTYVI